MTEAEKNEIVGLVMNQISSQAVDFDIETEQPQANDLLTAVRQTSSGAYVGVTIKWNDVARIATELANQAATRAEQAKTNVENMKSSVEQTVTDFNALAEQKKQEVQGVYQSDLNELKGDLGDISLVNKFVPNYTKTEGAYVSQNGDITSQVNYFYSDLIEVHKDDIVKVSGAIPNWGSILSKWTAEGQFINNIKSGGGAFEYIVSDEIEYLRFSAYEKESYSIYVYIFNDNSYKVVKPVIEKTIDEYIPNTEFSQDIIGYDVNNYVGEKAGYQYFDSNLVIGNTYKIVNNASESIAFELYDSTNTSVKSYGSVGANGGTIVIKVDTEHVKLGGWSKAIANITVELLYSEDTINGRIYNLENKTMSTPSFAYLLGKTLCIGDSLTEGAYYGDNYDFIGINKYNYPYFINKMTGLELTNVGMSGSSPSSRWTFFSTYDFTPYDTFLMWWGTNGGLTDTLLEDGVIDSSGNLISDYTTYANTNTGCYCKTIGRIISQVPNAKIFIANLYTQENLEVSNSVIEKIVDLYPNNVIGMVDMKSEGKFWSGGSGAMIPNIHPLNNIHFNTVGNYYLASHWIEKINLLIESNPQKMERYVPNN